MKRDLVNYINVAKREMEMVNVREVKTHGR